MFNKNKKAFTIIELIIVIAIIGILVLFAAPRIVNYVNQAKLTRIQHDVKVMETIMEDEITNHGYINYDDFPRNEKKLGALILANKLFEKQGHAKFIEDPAEVKYLASKKIQFQEIATTRLHIDNDLGLGGPVIGGIEDGFGSVSQKYKVIPKEWEIKSGTRLNGTFYVNEAGKVYYEPDKPLGPSANPTKPDACVAPQPLPDYDFEHEIGRIAKYHGNAQHLIIPAYFKVDGQCWPVRIIGKGAFMKGGFKSIKLPPTLKEIEPGALEDIGLEDEIIIPGSVDKVGPGAFDNNDLEDIIYEGSPEQVKPGAIPPSFPQKDGTDVSVTYKPPTPGQAGVIVKPNNSGGVTITGGGSSASPGGSTRRSTGPGNPHIPPYVNVDGKDKPVTEIGEGAYQGKGLITVDLPFTLEIIEDYAFAGNQLIGVTIPNGIKEIGHYAFGFNEKEKVGNIKGPDTVGTIKTVILKEKEQFNKIDKYGDILEGGTKVNMFKSTGGEMGPDIRLKDHIWVTSAGNVVIDKEYIGNNEDNSALLKDIISNAEELRKENYEPVSWGELEKALSNAKNIVNDKDSSKKDIDKALDDLESAIANLKEKPGDKTNLITKINEANKLKEADYESGWNELQNALSDANIVVNNPQATQTEIDRAILDIIGAIDKLTIKPGDKSGLLSKLEEVGKLEEADYESGWPELQAAIQAANIVVNNPQATQTEIDRAINNIQTAINELVDTSEEQTGLINPIEPREPIAGEIAIATAEELAKIGKAGYPLNGKYILTSDIDLSGINWTPIGSFTNNTNKSPFTGTFDGNGYEITGLRINRPTESNVGLFRYTEGAIIRNVALENINVTGEGTVGGLVGMASNRTRITNSYATGEVAGSENYVGGLVGVARERTTITNSYYTGSVKGRGDRVGGLVGYAYMSTISNSYTTGSVTGHERVGGLVGFAYESTTITNSYSTGSVTGSGWSVGGLVGRADNSSNVSNSYATGSVKGDGNVSGIVGYANRSAISNSYATGSVTGRQRVGGLVGQELVGSINNSYWDTDTTKQTTSAGGGTGKTTTDMKKKATYKGWDFVNVWKIEGGVSYPTLINNPERH